MDTDILKSIPLFADESDEDLSVVSTFAELVQVSEGKVLVEEGAFSNDFMAIREGTAEVRRGDEKIAELGPGDIFGEAGVVERAPRNATVVATSDMTLIKLTHWELKRMEKRLPHLAQKIESTVQERSG